MVATELPGGKAMLLAKLEIISRHVRGFSSDPEAFL